MWMAPVGALNDAPFVGPDKRPVAGFRIAPVARRHHECIELGIGHFVAHDAEGRNMDYPAYLVCVSRCIAQLRFTSRNVHQL